MKLNIQLFADGKVVIETDLDKKGFETGLNKVKNVAKRGFKVVATSVGVVSTAMAGALTYGVKYNATIENLTTSFEVMTGSADKATELVEKLKKVGAETPYELEGLASTVQLLMQYGMTADEAYESTLSLGDIAQGSADKMQGIALALGQMSSYTKVTLADIKQMITNGFNPLQEISERTGESMESLYDRVSKGTLSVDEIKKSFKAASSEGGKFYKSMEKQSKTLNGQLSTLKDNASSLAGTLSEGLTGAITNDVLPALNDFLQTLETSFSEEGFAGFSEALGEGIADMLTTIAEGAPQFIDNALLIIQNFVTGINDNLPQITTSAISIVTTLITGCLSMAPQVLQTGINLVTGLIQGIAQSAPTLIPAIIDALLVMVDTFVNNIYLMHDTGNELIFGLIDGIIGAIPTLVEKLPIILETIFFQLLKALPQSVTIGFRIIFALVSGLIGAIPEIVKKIPTIIGNMIDGFKTGVSDFVKVGKDFLGGLWEGVKSKWESLKSKVSDLAGSIVEKFKSVFGIESPSKVMRDEVGKYLAEGVGVGFDDELGNVYKDMQRAVDLETSKMSANVQTSGTYQMAMAGTPTFNLVDNANNTTQLVINGRVLAEVVNTENRNREVATA